MAAKKKGTGLLMVWCDVPADKEGEFNRWYNEEHLGERMAIPGFLSAARYEAVKARRSTCLLRGRPGGWRARPTSRSRKPTEWTSAWARDRRHDLPPHVTR